MTLKPILTSFRPAETEESETLALNMLAFMAEDESSFSHFLQITGLDLQTLCDFLPRPETLAAIMDYMLQHEDILATFCQTYNLSSEKLWRLRRHLPGSPLE